MEAAYPWKTVDPVRDFPLNLYSEFETREDLDIFMSHPSHTGLKDLIFSLTETRALVDYES